MRQKKWDVLTAFYISTNGFCVKRDFSLQVLGNDISIVSKVTRFGLVQIDFMKKQWITNLLCY